MNKIEWGTEDGVPDESDLWKLFSDRLDSPSENVQFYSNLKPLLAKVRLKDVARFFRVYRVRASFAGPSEDLRFRATVTDAPELLLANHLKTLRLPTFLREHDKLAIPCRPGRGPRPVFGMANAPWNVLAT